MASKGLGALIKRGFHEIPDVMAAGVLGAGSIVTLCVLVYRNRDVAYRDVMYRYNYTVKRSDDVKDKDIHPEMYN